MGLGTTTGELIPERTTAELTYHKDPKGNYVKTRLDQTTLEEMAQITDGAYFHSSLEGGELDAIYQEIATMDKKELGSTRFTQYEERFQIPLLLALVCFGMGGWMSDRRRRREEWRGRFA